MSFFWELKEVTSERKARLYMSIDSPFPEITPSASFPDPTFLWGSRATCLPSKELFRNLLVYTTASPDICIVLVETLQHGLTTIN